MKSRYKELLKITRDIRSYGKYLCRLDMALFALRCDFISVELYRFLKRKMVQNAYLNGVANIDFLVDLYFSGNDIDSFNHYVIKDKKGGINYD